MLTDFAGRKVTYKNIWDLQSKLDGVLATIRTDMRAHEEQIVILRKQEKRVLKFLGLRSIDPASKPSGDVKRIAA